MTILASGSDIQTTDPNNPDTDGDGILDGQEIADGTNPLNPCDSKGGTPPMDSLCGVVVAVSNEIISTNGNSGNNHFNIVNIEKYPENTVEIFNRWGVLVYNTVGYDNRDNSFRGISTGRNTVNQSDKLPPGVYFYVFTFVVETETQNESGYLYIVNK